MLWIGLFGSSHFIHDFKEPNNLTPLAIISHYRLNVFVRYSFAIRVSFLQYAGPFFY